MNDTQSNFIFLNKKFIDLPKKYRLQIYSLLNISFNNDKSFTTFYPFIPYTNIIMVIYKNIIIGISCLIPINILIEKYRNLYCHTDYPLPIITMNGLFMNNLCVNPKFRNKKLSKIIINMSINYCKINNYDHIICQVRDNNFKAMKLYNNFKFRIHSKGIYDNNKWNIMYYVIP